MMVEDDKTRETVVNLDDFFEKSLDCVAVAGFDGYFKRVNPSWTRTLGWSAAELMGRPSIEFVHPDDRPATLAGRQRLRDGGALGPLVNRYLSKDGGFRWFEWRSVADVQRDTVYAVARDITDWKRSEEQLRAAKEEQEQLQRRLIFSDRMASVGTLAAGVAHEINNPLVAVAANLALIIEALNAQTTATTTTTTTAELLEMARDASAGAARIQKIVRGLQTFSRAESEQRVPVDVAALLDLSVELTANQIRHRARLVKSYSDVPRVSANESRLGQVFVNLLVNAAQAIPEDGGDHEIRLVLRRDPQGRVVVEVQDNGVGIPPTLLERVFDPFFTTRPVGGGTGLGLSVSHAIVTDLGGELSARSEPGLGTTFHIALPPASTALPRPAASVTDVSGPRVAAVLVIDDEASVGDVLRRMLKAHAVTTVTTAQEALALLEDGRRFDVVLSDLMMPGMSGMDLHHELERRFPDVAPRVVFISGGAFTPSARAFLERVKNERLDKPFAPHTVRELVDRFVAADGTSSPPAG